MDRPIITLCGSSRFKREFSMTQAKLTFEGNVVLSLGLFSQADNLTLKKEDVARLVEVHKQKIRMADSIYVIDPGGYVGESTEREIEYAVGLGKSLRYFSDEYPAIYFEDFEEKRFKEKNEGL